MIGKNKKSEAFTVAYRMITLVGVAIICSCATTGRFHGDAAMGYVDRYPHIEQEVADAAPVPGTYAITYNFKDGKRLYEYRLVDGRVEWRINKGDWTRLPKGNPVATVDGVAETLSVKRIAADNNRLLVWAGASNGKVALFWYCVKYDQAKWVEKLLKRFRRTVGKVTGKDYYTWTTQVHQENTWTNALRLRNDQFDTSNVMRIRRQSGLPGADTLPQADNLPLYRSLADGEYSLSRKLPGDTGTLNAKDIAGIAAGNWNGTVVTYYLFFRSTRTVYYVDEEVLMDTLRVVARVGGHGRYNPYPLPDDALIDASNSVLFCTKPTETETKIHFIRWDFHNREDFTFWPLHWCEDEWHVLDPPKAKMKIRYMRAFTNDEKSYAKKGVWDIPRSAWGISYGGMLGHVKKKEISTYPVTVFIVGDNGEQWAYHTDSAEKKGTWTKLR